MENLPFDTCLTGVMMIDFKMPILDPSDDDGGLKRSPRPKTSSFKTEQPETSRFQNRVSDQFLNRNSNLNDSKIKKASNHT